MTKRRILLKIEIFVLIFAVLLSSVTFVMRYKGKGWSHISFYENPNSFDVLFFGSSHIYSGFSPLQLYNDYGITSYCKSGSAQILKLTSEIIKESFTLSSPDLAVIDLYEVAKMIGSDRIAREERPWIHSSVDDIPFSFSKVRLINNYLNYRNDDFNFFFECYVPLYLYHSTWDKLKKGDFIFSDCKKGFFFRTYVESLKEPEIVPKSDRKNLSFEYENLLRDVISFCRKNNAKILFTAIPYSDNSVVKEQKHFNEIEYLLKNKKDVRYINYFHILDEVNLDFSTDFNDDDHLNHSGAQKITSHIGKYIKEHYDIPDRRLDPAYAKWNEDYKLYVQDIFARELNSLKEPAQYVQFIASKKEALSNICVFVVKSVMGGAKIVNILNLWNWK